MPERKILVLGPKAYYLPFLDFGNCFTVVENFHSVDLIVFTGGEDVNPALYGDSKHKWTSLPNTQRDAVEQEFFDLAVKNGIPMVGICRGAQFLNVMNGGRLVQHVTNHGRPHSVVTDQGETFQVTSTHHQMMMLTPGMSYKLLAWANGISSTYEVGPEDKKPHLRMGDGGKVIEPECVLFPDTMSLAFQWHPEYMEKHSPCFRYTQEMIAEYLL